VYEEMGLSWTSSTFSGGKDPVEPGDLNSRVTMPLFMPRPGGPSPISTTVLGPHSLPLLDHEMGPMPWPSFDVCCIPPNRVQRYCHDQRNHPIMPLELR
jgi:hypothetical protein